MRNSGFSLARWIVDAQPADRYVALVTSDPHHGGKTFENIRRAYQRGNLEDFQRFRTAIEAIEQLRWGALRT